MIKGALSKPLNSRIFRPNAFSSLTNMVLTLYGFSLSTCTQRVATILHEKEVAFKFVEVDLRKGEHKTPEYLAKQPFGQVPVLDVRCMQFHDCLVLTLFSRMMASKFTRAVPSLAISLINTKIRARRSSRPISRARPFSSKQPLLKHPTSIRMHLELLWRRFSSRRSLYHASLGQSG